MAQTLHGKKEILEFLLHCTDQALRHTIEEIMRSGDWHDDDDINIDDQHHATHQHHHH